MKTRKMMLMAAALLGFVVMAGLLLAGCGGNDDPTDKGRPQDVLIWQAYAGDGRGNGVSHNFIELYNTSDKAITLTGWYLWYAGSHKFFNEDEDNKVDDLDCDTPWEKITLTGTIPAKGSYLIRGGKANGTGNNASDWWRIDLTDSQPDIDLEELYLVNRGFKLALIEGGFNLNQGDVKRADSDDLEVQGIPNPFKYNGGKVPGYVDMVGGINDPAPGGDDRLYGYEGPELDYSDADALVIDKDQELYKYARVSAQEALRRNSLVDTDNNADDFYSMRYTTKRFKPDGDSQHVNGVETSDCAKLKPRSSKDGSWNPVVTRATTPDPVVKEGEFPEPTGNTLLIWQAGATNPASMGAISHSFVELYNAGSTAVNLSGYSLQYAAGGSEEDGEWTVINLTGTIAPKHSYLILGNGYTATGGQEGTAMADADGDQKVDFDLDNNAFKVALMSNQTKLTAQNPYKLNDEWTKANGYVDMLGAINSGVIHGFEQEVMPKISKQQTARRVSLTDSDNNDTDFTNIGYRTSDAAVEFRTPKNLAYGAWNPVTGIKQ